MLKEKFCWVDLYLVNITPDNLKYIYMKILYKSYKSKGDRIVHTYSGRTTQWHFNIIGAG